MPVGTGSGRPSNADELSAVVPGAPGRGTGPVAAPMTAKLVPPTAAGSSGARPRDCARYSTARGPLLARPGAYGDAGIVGPGPGTMASAIADRFPLSDRLSPNTYSALIGPAEAGDDAKTRTAVRSRDRIRIATDLREFVDADDSRVRSACEIKVVRVPRLEPGASAQEARTISSVCAQTVANRRQLNSAR